MKNSIFGIVIDNQPLEVIYKYYKELFSEISKNFLINQSINLENLYNALILNFIYFTCSIFLFYYSFNEAKKKGTLINMGE